MKPRKTRKTDPTTAAPVKAAVDGTQEATPQYMAEMFTGHAQMIRVRARGYVYRQDDPELAAMYDLWRGSLEVSRRIIKERLTNAVDLPELPPLPGSNFFAGMVNLADYCTDAAKRLCACPKSPRQSKADALKPLILKVFNDLSPDKKRDYLKGAMVLDALRPLGYDGKSSTIARALTTLVHAEVLDSVKGLGFRLDQAT